MAGWAWAGWAWAGSPEAGWALAADSPWAQRKQRWRPLQPGGVAGRGKALLFPAAPRSEHTAARARQLPYNVRAHRARSKAERARVGGGAAQCAQRKAARARDKQPLGQHRASATAPPPAAARRQRVAHLGNGPGRTRSEVKLATTPRGQGAWWPCSGLNAGRAEPVPRRWLTVSGGDGVGGRITSVRFFWGGGHCGKGPG